MATTGSLQFFDANVPPLEAGEYQLTITHKVTDDANQPVADFSAQQTFVVDAPRFVLDSTNIYAQYPPANARGDFAQALPHIVFSRPTLPWDRLLDTNAQNAQSPAVQDMYQPPWVAILLFDAADTGADSGWKARSVLVSKVVTPESGVLGPALGTLTGDQQNMTCMALDVPAPLFASIAPARDELAYLAHVRQVDASDAWFSVVIGNRLPNITGTNTAHLVSLEGLGDYLPGGPKAGSLSGFSTIRLVSLASWTFTCEEPSQSFRELMIDLAAGAAPLKPPDAIATAATSAEQLVSGALNRGYVPLGHAMLDGEQAVSWYRGPLVPVNVEHQPSDAPYLTADNAKCYDPATGLFDVSYAVAWQIGRLLALADATFATALMNWRRRSSSENGALSRQLARDVLRKLAVHAAQAVHAAPGQDQPIVKAADPTGLACHAGAIRGLLTGDQIAEATCSGADPVARIREIARTQSLERR